MTNLHKIVDEAFPLCFLIAYWQQQTRPLLHLFDLLKLYSISCSSWNFGSHQCVLRLSLQRLQLLQIYTHKNPGKSKNSPKTKNQKAQHQSRLKDMNMIQLKYKPNRGQLCKCLIKQYPLVKMCVCGGRGVLGLALVLTVVAVVLTVVVQVLVLTVLF